MCTLIEKNILEKQNIKTRSYKMPQYRYKNKVTDDLVDATDIVKQVGRMITEGKTDVKSALDNLARAVKKLESAKYFIDRE
jgi:hypothetical protein